MDEALLKTASQRLKAAQSVLVMSHVRADGDAVGSLLGMGMALRQAGKGVQMLLVDGVPQNFKHLPSSEQVQKNVKQPFDFSIMLDSSDVNRVGSIFPIGVTPDLNIDHHITNLYFAKINLVDVKAVATAAMLAEFLPQWGYPITPAIADVLLTGIITDTLGFRTQNMTSQALHLAASLVEKGANLPNMYYHALVQRTFEAARFWGLGLVDLQREDRIVWTTLTQPAREQVGYPGGDDADLVNFLASIKDVDVFLVFVEQPQGSIKVSWRSQPGIDVSQVALGFGGGGHVNAAGADIKGSLIEVQKKVLQATKAVLNGNAQQ